MLPIFLDVEASSLSGKSYPIEIAWNTADGNIESHLINPYFIDNWLDWDPGSQAAHGLSRSYLSDHGENPFSVAERMNFILSGCDIFSNAAEYDAFWIDQLFKEIRLEQQFSICDFFTLVPDEIRYGGFTGKNNLLANYQEKARKRAGVPAHRASNDVKYLIELYLLASPHD